MKKKLCLIGAKITYVRNELQELESLINSVIYELIENNRDDMMKIIDEIIESDKDELL